MKKAVLFLSVIISGACSFAQETADSLFRNYLYDSRTRYFRQLPVHKGAFIFWGDSITDWGDWGEFTGYAYALNRGIAGDNTYGLLNRTDEVVRHLPRKLFILAGTNDINIHIPLSASIRNYEQLIRAVRRQSSQTEIYVQSVLPVNEQLINRAYYTGTNEAIRRMNHSLDSLARALNVVYVDLFTGMSNFPGQLDTAYTYDGLHLTAAGYLKWVEILRNKKYLPGGASAGGVQPTRAVDWALTHGRQGAVVQLPGFFTGNMPELSYSRKVKPGPQFIISDDPEYIRDTSCIALRETVRPGPVRLYVYNVNGVSQPEKMPRMITAVLKNKGNEVLHMRMLRYSSPLPGDDYYRIGKQGLAGYFASKGSDSIISVPPGEAIPIDRALEQRVVTYDQLVHGLYEFTVDQPAEITILQTFPGDHGPAALERIHAIVPSDHANAGRGLFDVCNYAVSPEGVLDTKDGPVTLLVADGKKDPWIEGREGSAQRAVALSGNYGVMYEITVKWKSSDGRGLALVSWNPWSGNSQWCGGMANTVVVSEGKFKGGIVQLPADRLTTGAPPEAVLVQVFPPSRKKKVQTIKLVYSPPGASCIPTPLVFIPITQKSKP